MSSRQNKLSRSELKELKYHSLMDAAVKVVGERGFTGASISRVTEAAGVSQGTFYNYFADRQALFNVLLPYVGTKMTNYISANLRPGESGIDRDVGSLPILLRFPSAKPRLL